MAYLTKQIPGIVNDAVNDALGKVNGVTNVDTTDFVSMGKKIGEYDLYDGFFGSLVNRVAKTVYFVRSYKGRTRSVLRDEHEYGAFIQKVYYKMPEAVDNPTWAIPTGESQYHQVSPYDVEGTIAVSSLIFGGKGTWSIEVIRPVEQIKSAFDSLSSMLAFIDGLYVTIENAYKLEEERLVSLAVNTAMADALSGGKSRNLLAEYNGIHSDAPLTVSNALTSAEFLKYASMEINRTMNNMKVMSTVFNKAGWETFTDEDSLVVEMLAQFASASDMYLQADTFHNELVKLPNYDEVPFWQSSGNAFGFADCSKISIKNDAFVVAETNPTGTVEQGGIICFLHDVENVAAYFGSRRSWELPNPRSEVIVHGEKAEKGFAVDNHANAVVFYIAE